MSRRPINPGRRIGDSGSVPFVSSFHQKSRTSPLLSVGLVLLGAFLLIGYNYSSSGGFHSEKDVSQSEGVSCTLEVLQAIPLLKKVYGDGMRKVLHVGPDTCSVVSKLLKEEDTEAWGVEPYDLEDADSSCKSLVRKGLVRVADIKFPLPYRPKSFSLVIVSDALDYLSPKYLNKTLPDLARVSMDGLVIFAGYPGQQRPKVSELSKFGRPAKLRSSSWWIRYFVQTNLEENETIMKKFDQAAVKRLKQLHFGYSNAISMEGLSESVLYEAHKSSTLYRSFSSMKDLKGSSFIIFAVTSMDDPEQVVGGMQTRRPFEKNKDSFPAADS